MVKISDLPLCAQLNIAADKLVTEGLQKLQQKQIVPLDPISEVMFHYRNRTITINFKRTTRNNIPIPDLAEYYMDDLD